MGDMADMALEEVMVMEDLRLHFRLGGIPIDEAFEVGIVDEFGREDFVPMFRCRRGRYSGPLRPSQLAKRCNYCGKTNLIWADTADGWRLAELDGTIHNCRVASDDEFDDLTKI